MCVTVELIGYVYCAGSGCEGGAEASALEDRQGDGLQLQLIQPTRTGCTWENGEPYAWELRAHRASLFVDFRVCKLKAWYRVGVAGYCVWGGTVLVMQGMRDPTLSSTLRIPTGLLSFL